jgi:hypothetical protein
MAIFLITAAFVGFLLGLVFSYAVWVLVQSKERRI